MKKIILLSLSFVLGINSFIKSMDEKNNKKRTFSECNEQEEKQTEENQIHINKKTKYETSSLQKVENTTLSHGTARGHLALAQAIPIIELQNIIIDYLKQWVEVKALSGHTNSVKWIAVAPDSKCLAFGGCDGNIKIWHYEGIEELSDQ